MNRRIMLAAAVFGLALCGCDGAWLMYERIELGQPLPAEGLPDGLVRSASGAAYAESTWRLLPLGVRKSRVAVLLDPEGVVIAKTYGKNTITNWLFLMSGKDWGRSEVQVPAAWLGGTPKDWDGGEEYSNIDDLADEFAARRRGEGGKGEAAEPAGALTEEVDMAAVFAAAAARGRHVGSYCLAAQVVMDHLPGGEGGWWGPAESLRPLFEDPAAFAAAPGPAGKSRRWREDGVRMEVSDLGAGRVQFVTLGTEAYPIFHPSWGLGMYAIHYGIWGTE